MEIGVTGTGRAYGMTGEQKLAWLEVLQRLECPITLHHGDCVGADAQAHDIARPWVDCIIVHPPVVSKKRAFKIGDVELPRKDFLVRNHNIVDAVDTLFAFPRGFNEELRSGTWATVRYARKRGVPVVIIYPSGKEVHE